MCPKVLLPLHWTSRLSSCVQCPRYLVPISRSTSTALMQTRLWTQARPVPPAILESCIHHLLLFRADRVTMNRIKLWECLQRIHLLSRPFKNKCYPLTKHGNSRFRSCSNKSKCWKPKWRNYVPQTTKGIVNPVDGLSLHGGLKTTSLTKTLLLRST